VTFPFFTVGHSTRSREEFVDLLRTADIGFVADIRTVPKSRTNPQFNKDALPGALAPLRIGYEHLAALGGLRGKSKDLPSHLNGFWTNDSFHNYADYALSPAFRAGLDHLIELGRAQRCAMMCSEAVWWRCHRRIVADHLIARGETVLHLMGHDRMEPARLTAGAVVRPDGSVVYPAQGS
jgi:uncharacterized protein (DUF488 family)